MTPEQIERLLKAIEQLNEAVQSSVARSRPDPYRDLKVFVLGLMTALVAGWVSHWLTVRREEGKRKLEEWERVKDWDEDGRKDDLRGTDLTPPWLWLRLRLPRRLAWRLPQPRYLDLEEVNLGADKQHEKGANLRRAKLPLVNLEDANLQEAHLRFASLEQANLRFANLQEAHLSDANLQEANLRDANLQEANLADANLQGADLRRVNLQGAYLRRVNLQGAYLLAANLRKANLAGANLQEALLRGANLQRARWDDETVWPEGFTPPEDAMKVKE